MITEYAKKRSPAGGLLVMQKNIGFDNGAQQTLSKVQDSSTIKKNRDH